MGLTANEQTLLEELLNEAMAFAEAGDRPRALESLGAAERLAPEHPEVVLERARWCLDDGDRIGALRRLEALVDAHPGQADARHLLGELRMEAGDRAGAIAQWVHVHRLDQARASVRGAGARADLAFVEAEAQRVLDALPEPFASAVAAVPVVLEARPHAELVEEGFDPRALGLFEGPGAGDDALALQPTRIVVFWDNLLQACPDDANLAAEIEVTVLHEIGHYFGLDEDEVAALGLA